MQEESVLRKRSKTNNELRKRNMKTRVTSRGNERKKKKQQQKSHTARRFIFYK